MSAWDDLWAGYCQHLMATGRSRSTREARRFQLARFFRFCESLGLELGQIDENALLAFHRHLREVPGARGLWVASSILAALLAVRSFFTWAVEQQLLCVHPGPHWQLPKPPAPSIRLLTPDEMEKLLAAPDPSLPTGLRDQTILELLYSTGLRRRECHQLDLADLDLAGKRLTVRRGKGGRSRVLPVGETLALLLAFYLQEGRPALRPVAGETALFISSQTGRRLSYGMLKRLLETAGDRVGINASLHGLRHACASHLLEGGADVRHIQELLGHRWVTSTERYTHLQPLELQREHRHTHPRGKKR